MPKLNEFKYDFSEHPPYLPNLAPSDYCLFRTLKQPVLEKHSTSNEVVISVVEYYFAELIEDLHRDGMQRLQDHWRECIELEGGYIE